jgi:hypothetical protein
MKRKALKHAQSLLSSRAQAKKAAINLAQSGAQKSESSAAESNPRSFLRIDLSQGAFAASAGAMFNQERRSARTYDLAVTSCNPFFSASIAPKGLRLA